MLPSAPATGERLTVGHGDFSGFQSGVLSVFLLDTGNPVARGRVQAVPVLDLPVDSQTDTAHRL